MTFEELGTILRTEREKRGYSLDDVASRLKMSVRVIRALEEGDRSSLPHAVYVRGFVRSYGSFLGLDGPELEAALSLVSNEEPVQPSPVYSAPELPVKSRGTVVVGFMLAVCFAAAAFFWIYRDADLFSNGQQARLTSAIPAPVATSAVNPSPSGKETSSADAAPAPDTAGNASAPEEKRTSGAPEQIPALPSAPVSTPSAAPSRAPAASVPAANVGTPSAAPAQQALPSGQHKIIITALSECWIHSSADSTDTRQFSLRKGDTFALTFTDKLVLKLGNAGGVRIRYDGADLPVPGKEGQVKTLTFPPSE